jgi:hypothetical protein
LAWLEYYQPGTLDRESEALKRVPYARNYKNIRSEYTKSRSSQDGRSVALGEILTVAIANGWIRSIDANWIQKQLGDEIYKYPESFA